MGNRKESLKKALGLNEYPWSSDDENESLPLLPVTTSPNGPPPADESPSSSQPSIDQQTTDFFRSLLNRQNAVTRSSSNIDLQSPNARAVAQAAAAPGALGGDGPSSDMQRILAYRRVSSTLARNRPGTARSWSNLFSAHGGPSETRMVQFTDQDTLMRARRRALERAATVSGVIHMHYRRDCGGGTNMYETPRRRRTPPVPPVRIRIGTQPLTPSRGAMHRPPQAPCCAGAAAAAAGAGGGAPGPARSVAVARADDDVEMRAVPAASASASPVEAGGIDSPLGVGGAAQGCLFGDAGARPGPWNCSSSVVAVAGSLDQDTSEGSVNSASAMALDGEAVEFDADAAAGASSAHATENATPEGATEQDSPVGETSDGPRGTKRKREEIVETEPSTVQEFNLSLLRLLECPVCLEWMEPPMSQCRRGHLVCGRCRARLASCPVCRTAFSSVRNRAMEGVAEMLRYPCRHGCGREVRLRRRAPHEASCASRRYRCVVPTCGRAPMPLHELALHLQSKHTPLVKTGRKHKFALKLNAEQHDTWAVVAYRELFTLRIDVDLRSWAVGVHVAFVGPKCWATGYSYEVTVLGQHHSRKIVYTRATHCDLESSSLNVTRQDCFHLTIDQALNFLRVKNRHCELDKLLHFYVEITKNTDVPEVNIEDSDLS